MNKAMDDAGLLLRKIFVYGSILLLYAGIILISTFSIIGIPIAIFAMATFIIQYLYADRIILKASGARVLSPGDAPDLENIVRGQSERLGIVPPRLALVNNDIPNAYAVGRKNKTAVLTFTTGIFNALNRRELESVIAHELSHVKNNDSFVVTFSSFTVAMFSSVLYSVIYMFLGGGRANNIAQLISMGISFILSNTIGLVLVNTVSRYREYGADAGAARLTGDPDAMISALKKISDVNYSLASRTGLDPAKALTTTPIGNVLNELFSTHPLLENRIAALERFKASP